MINSKEKKFISAVVYVHNNESIIIDFLNRINRILSMNFDKYEIICVNDYSIDNTVNKIQEISKDFGDTVCTIVNMSYFQGSEVSMNAGIDLAIGDFVFEFDHVYIDYDETLIMETYHHLLEGYDIVATTNQKEKLSSKIFYKLYNMGSHSQYKLCTETFRILSRRAINRVHSMSKSIPYRKALYANCGLKTDIISYASISNIQKEMSKELLRNRKDVASTSLILFTNIAYQFAMFMSILMIVATLLGVLYTIVVYFLGKPVEGYTTMMLIMSASFFGVFTILAIIIKYCALMIELIFKTQRYTIESINKL